MIRIHNGNLVIEIDPQSQSPLEKLGCIQHGLYDMVLCIASSVAPNMAKENAFHHLHCLLQAFQLNERQYGVIDNGISEAVIPTKSFTQSK